MDPSELDQLVFHPWVAQTPRSVPAFVSGEGSFLVDHTGRRYLDFSSQLVFTNVGHQDPRVVSAIKEQAERLCTLAPTWISARGPGGRAKPRTAGGHVPCFSMTSPVEEIRVECPTCSKIYTDWYRASLNLDLDDFDEDYVREASTASPPECGHAVDLGTLVVEGDVWRFP